MSYLLPNVGIQCIHANTLILSLVDYLRSNPTRNGINRYNFLTKPPNGDVNVVWE